MSNSSRLIAPGSVLGVSSPTQLDAAINFATLGVPGRSLSHLAIVARQPHTDRLLVFEAALQTRLSEGKQLACSYANKVVDGWQAHGLGAWLYNRMVTRQSVIWHYSLAQPLYPHEEERLTQECIRDLGAPYDLWGAVGARTLGLGWLFHIAGRFLPNREDLDNLFCSEGVLVKLRTVGRFADGNASRWNPNHATRFLRRAGILLRPNLVTHKEV